MPATLPRFSLPMPAEDFLRRHWQREPLVMRGAAAHLEHPSPELLAALALENGVESRLAQGGGDAPWQSRHGPFRESDFTALPDSHWTLLVQSVDHYLTEVSLLLDDFDFLPGWRLEDIMISHARHGGGVGPHFDRYDVFLLQARGSRRWRIGPRCDETTPVRDRGGLTQLEDMPITAEYLLEPGDALYLPPWVAHQGDAADDECTTWSVGFRAPPLHEVLARLADRAHENHPRALFTDPGRTPAPEPGEIADEDLRALKRQAFELAEGELLESALGELLSEPRQATLDFDVDLSHIRARAPEAGLVRHGGARVFCQPRDGGLRLWINGRDWQLGPREAPLGALLARRRLIVQRDLDDVLTPEGSLLLEEWLDDGYFARL